MSHVTEFSGLRTGISALNKLRRRLESPHPCSWVCQKQRVIQFLLVDVPKEHPAPLQIQPPFSLKDHRRVEPQISPLQAYTVDTKTQPEVEHILESVLFVNCLTKIW